MTKIEIEIPEYLVQEANLIINSGDFKDLSDFAVVAFSYFSGRYHEETRLKSIETCKN